jgi:tRNA-splicing ligase RtcB
MPFVEGVAVMPDVHYGKGSTVGTVIATRGAVIPACVGVDIGCGMIAVRTNLKIDDVLPRVKEIREGIERRIPVGVGTHGLNSRISTESVERAISYLEHSSPIVKNMNEHIRLLDANESTTDKNFYDKYSKDWRNAIGTLGGGNHFIEICVGKPHTGEDEVDFALDSVGWPMEIWVILHSGSRGVGNKIGIHYTKVAKEQAKKYKYDGWLPDPDLAYLVEGTVEFSNYMRDLHWAQEFARLNREEMMDRVMTQLSYSLYGCENDIDDLEEYRINCHHNFTQRESYNGNNYIITRKGAIEAKVGQYGLIPGSMGAASYIVEGLGNVGAFNSAPHGAGRKMSRTKARSLFNVEELTTRMSEAGIESRIRPEILDEHPSSYKDIDVVMKEAKTLVKPLYKLKQIISVKGD